MLGEIWADQPAILPFYDNEFDLNFDYPLYYVIKDLILEQKFSDFQSVLNYRRDNFHPNAQWVTFLSNHDNPRSLSLFNDDFDLWKLGTLVNYMLPGTPMIYYGDEYGMTGKNPPDSNVRKKMIFGKSDLKHSKWIKDLTSLRKKYTLLTEADSYETPTLEFKVISDSLFSISRFSKKGNERITAIFNLSVKSRKIHSDDIVSAGMQEGTDIFHYDNNLLKIHDKIKKHDQASINHSRKRFCTVFWKSTEG